MSWPTPTPMPITPGEAPIEVDIDGFSVGISEDAVQWWNHTNDASGGMLTTFQAATVVMMIVIGVVMIKNKLRNI